MPDPIAPETIVALARKLGSQTELARRIGVGRDVVYRWTLPDGNRHKRRPTGLYAEAVRRLMAETNEEE